MIRVVIAEDQQMVLGALAALLELEGLEVVGQAADGDTALRLVKETTPDILLTDIEMPGLTGLELAQKVAVAAPATKVVIVTTFARSGYLKHALDAGTAGYLPKELTGDQPRTTASGSRWDWKTRTICAATSTASCPDRRIGRWLARPTDAPGPAVCYSRIRSAPPSVNCQSSASMGRMTARDICQDSATWG